MEQAQARDSLPDSIRTISLGVVLDRPRGATPRKPLRLDSDLLAGSLRPSSRASAARCHATRTSAGINSDGSHHDAVLCHQQPLLARLALSGPPGRVSISTTAAMCTTNAPS
jgi:hypothetical protein